jgi:hypothetical protein
MDQVIAPYHTLLPKFVPGWPVLLGLRLLPICVTTVYRVTPQIDVANKSPDLCSGCTFFKSGSSYQLSWLIIFWDITPYSPLKVNRQFGRTYRLHLQGRRISQASSAELFYPPDFTLVSSSDYSSSLKIEAMFLRNIGWLLIDYTAIYPRR